MDTVSMLEIKARPGNAVRLMHIQEVVGRVVTLLNDADRELGNTQEAAKSSIARAASILMAEIGPSAAMPARGEGVAPLLPWQASRVREYIERNIAQAIRVSDLSAARVPDRGPLLASVQAEFRSYSACLCATPPGRARLAAHDRKQHALESDRAEVRFQRSGALVQAVQKAHGRHACSLAPRANVTVLSVLKVDAPIRVPRVWRGVGLAAGPLRRIL